MVLIQQGAVARTACVKLLRAAGIAVLFYAAAAAGYAHADTITNDLLTPSQTEQQAVRIVGNAQLRALYGSGQIILDPWVNDQLNYMFKRIYSQTGLNSPIGLVIVNDPQINAFAVPGGLIAVNTGLIRSARDVDELAGVLAHEVAHISQRHYQRIMENSKTDKLIAVGGVLASLFVLSKNNSETGSALAVGTQAFVIDRQLTFSRAFEQEADRVGIKLMAQANYNPIKMATFFETMESQTRNNNKIPAYLMTHPLTKDRIKDAYLLAQETGAVLPTQIAHADAAAHFAEVQWRLNVLTKQIPINSMATLETDNSAILLGLAQAYLQSNETEKARNVINKVLQQAPNNMLANLLAADIDVASAYANRAIMRLEPLYLQMPENRALALALVHAYISNHQSMLAFDVLDRLAMRTPQDLVVWQYFAEAAEGINDLAVKQVQLLRYRAEVKFWQNDLAGAQVLLSRASQVASNFGMKARIDRRIAQITQIQQEAAAL